MGKKSQGRVVCVSSIEHWEGSYDFEKVTQKTGAKSYATSKLMQMLLAFELQRGHGLMAAAVNPGGVMSGIWWYLRGWKATLWNLIAPLFLLTTAQGSQTIVHAATAPEYSGPAYFTPYKQKSWCPLYSDTLGCFNGATLGRASRKRTTKRSGRNCGSFRRTPSSRFFKACHYCKSRKTAQKAS